MNAADEACDVVIKVFRDMSKMLGQSFSIKKINMIFKSKYVQPRGT